MEDVINHPSHYECEQIVYQRVYQPIEFCQLFGFTVGNAFKYLFRRKHKGTELQDLKKAEYYLKRALDPANKNDWSFTGLQDVAAQITYYADIRDVYTAFVNNKDFLKGFTPDKDGLQRVLAFTQNEIANLEAPVKAA